MRLTLDLLYFTKIYTGFDTLLRMNWLYIELMRAWGEHRRIDETNPMVHHRMIEPFDDNMQILDGNK